jgi:hypothetical protein
MKVPFEILIEIALELSGRDLRGFRLVSFRCACAGKYSLNQNGFTVINVSRYLDAFEDLMACKVISGNTKAITLAHGDWPMISSYREWKHYPLLLAARYHFKLSGRLRLLRRRKATRAFADYRAFIKEEQERESQTDIALLARILESLPKLEAITITSVQYWSGNLSRNIMFSNLQSSIWLFPYMLDWLQNPAHTLLSAFQARLPRNLQSLTFDGTLDLDELNIATYPGIKRLRIKLLRAASDPTIIQQFLSAFPDLTEVSINFLSWGHVSLICHWENLQSLYFGHFIASEHDLYALFERHQQTIRYFRISNANLTQGTWRSLFAKIGELKSPAVVTLNGGLYERGAAASLH